jgi:nicotinate-nucleotide adenylyltransferase
MRIGFFGGSFDPPHRGHLAVALAAAQQFSLDRVLLAPTANQPLKPQGPQASFEDRLAMVGLLCAADTRLEASTLDGPAPSGHPNYTVETLQHLRDTLTAQDSLFAIAGIDAFLDIHRWRSPQRLLQLAQWIVVSRPGFDTSLLVRMDLDPTQRARVHLLAGVAEPASATAVRAALHDGRNCATLVPAPVLTYITQHRLYRE